jgi:hypothetical protein
MKAEAGLGSDLPNTLMEWCAESGGPRDDRKKFVGREEKTWHRRILVEGNMWGYFLLVEGWNGRVSGLEYV